MPEAEGRALPEPSTLSAEALIHRYLPLVRSAVRRTVRYLPAVIDEHDLLQEGIIALLDAHRRWSSDRANGARIETFLYHRVVGGILDAIRRADWVPRGVRAQVKLALRAYERMAQEMGATPKWEDVRREMRLPPQGVMREVALFSIEEAAEQEKPIELPDRHRPEDAIERYAVQRELFEAITSLPPRYQRVIVERYFRRAPMGVIAKELGVSESRVSQMHAIALTRLRARFHTRLEAVI